MLPALRMFSNKFRPFYNRHLSMKYFSDNKQIMKRKIRKMERRLIDVEVYRYVCRKLNFANLLLNENWKVDPRISEKNKKFIDCAINRGKQALDKYHYMNRFEKRVEFLKMIANQTAKTFPDNDILFLLSYDGSKITKAVFYRHNSPLKYEILDFSNYDTWRDHSGLTQRRKFILEFLDAQLRESGKEVVLQFSLGQDPEV